jgi:hypothetical protein
MKEQRFALCLAALLTASYFAAAQTPPNDDFANRTILTGSSISFTGTLLGSTIESAEGFGFPGYYPGPGGGSVWWTWATPVTTRVVIEIPPSPFTTNAELEVYTGNAINALTLIDQNVFGEPSGRYISFLASPTNNYQIRVGGIGTQPFSLRLTATNPPMFIFQPLDCVVSPFGSAFFSAMATGPRTTVSFPQASSATSYQWFFDGTPIAGQTSPSLIIHAVTSNQVGSYSVIASNIGGASQSSTVTLTVIDTNSVPQVVALPPTNSNRVPLALTGEPGRWYKIESSPDLKDWFYVVRWPLTNTTENLSLTRFEPLHFTRASLDVPTDVCVAQLKQLWWGQKVFAIESRSFPNSIATFEQIRPYVHLTPQGAIYACRSGGTYATGATLTNPPTCTLSSFGHKMTEMP